MGIYKLLPLILSILTLLGGTVEYKDISEIEKALKAETNVQNEADTSLIDDATTKEEMNTEFVEPSNTHTSSNSTSTTKENKDEVKKSKVQENQATVETIGRIEISDLDIKANLTLSQIRYTNQGLNNVGNTIIYVEDSKYREITSNMVIYVRNTVGKKVTYKVYNSFETNLSDTSFYNNETNKCELTLMIKIDENKILVVQAIEQ